MTCIKKYIIKHIVLYSFFWNYNFFLFGHGWWLWIYLYFLQIVLKYTTDITHKRVWILTVERFHRFFMSYSVRVIVILCLSFFVSGVVTEQQKISPVPTSPAPSSGFVPLQVCVCVYDINMFYVKMWIHSNAWEWLFMFAWLNIDLLTLFTAVSMR